MVQPLAVLNLLSTLVLVFGLTMSAPLALSFFTQDGALVAFSEALLATTMFGLLLRLITRGHHEELHPRDGFLLVSLAWAGLPVFAALPLMFYLPGLGFTKAYFEGVSGLTTTGSTVLVGLDYIAPAINLWRGQLQWMGGMGVMVLAVAILPLLGVGGSQLFRAETPGPIKDAKLTPRIAETAKGLWLVYALLTAVCVLAMKWAGMSWFDAVMHAFTTLSLGGLSSHDASYAYWNSPVIEAVTIFFMTIAGISFATHFLAVRKRSLSPYRYDTQALTYLAALLLSVLGIAVFLWANEVYAEFPTALRHAAFNVVSIATTTGYSNADYNAWPIFAPMYMLILCSFATCAGSTGAGIKMVRAMLLFKQAFREMMRILHPRAYLPVRLGGQVVENNIIFSVLAFMLVYGVSVIVITMLLALSGMGIETAFSAAIACINNMGPGLNEVGPAGNYAALTVFQTWLLAFAMLLGRLELMALLVVLTPAFWQK